MQFVQLQLYRFAVEIFFEDDDEEGEYAVLDKVCNFAEITVPNFTDRQFQSHFRMTPTTFENLLIQIKSVNVQIRLAGNPETSTEKQLLVCLWYLANIESFRSVADRFGISKSTAWLCVYKICRLLLKVNVRYRIIEFPDDDKCNQIMNAFRNKTGMPGVVGAIDGSHIPILAPKEHHVSYINRKGYHSMLLQGICDNKKFFLDCYAGEVGSVHDARLLRRSDIGRRLPGLQFRRDGHLLGDSAYPLLNNLMVPFKDNGHLNNIQRHYNIKHSKSRVVIEQAFALLKGRFRRLKLVETKRLDLIPLVIMSSCILHNICLLSDDIPQDINVRDEIEEERLMEPHNINPVIGEQQNNIATAKRNNIANTLYLRM